MKIAKGFLVASFAMTQMLKTVKSAFCSLNSSKKYPFSVPLVSNQNVLLRQAERGFARFMMVCMYKFLSVMNLGGH